MSKKPKKFFTKMITPGLTGLALAAQTIKDGGIVAFPTETVYGLGANCFDLEAVNKIFTAKGRPMDNPIIVHVSSTEQVNDVAARISPIARKLMDNFWPGPLTLIMQKKAEIPDKVTAGLDTVAVRMPMHQVAKTIIELSGVPIAAPSANSSGKPSPTTAQAVLSDMDGKIPLIIDSGPCEVGIESTVVDVTSAIPTILRPGMITHEMMEEIIGQVSITPIKNSKVQSPGTKYAHYSPNAALTIIKGPQAAVSRHISIKMTMDESIGKKSGVICYDQTKRNYGGNIISLGSRFNLQEVAKNLYEAFRKADEMKLDKVYIEALEGENEAIAIMNRIMHAANNNIEET